MGLGPLTQPMAYYVGLLAGTILIIATNAGIIGVSRLTYSMGVHRQFPDILRTVHPKYRTPWVAIVIYSVLAILMMIPASQSDSGVAFLGNLYAFGAMLSFTVAHASVIALRIRRPDPDQPFRSPLNLRVGRSTSRSSPSSAASGRSAPSWSRLGALPVGPLRGLRLAGPRDDRLRRLPPEPAPAADGDAVIRPRLAGRGSRSSTAAVVLHVTDADVADEMTVTALKLAGESGARVVALYPIEVPASRPLDAVTPEEGPGRRPARRGRGARPPYGVPVIGRLVRTRHAGRALVDEAEPRGSEVIVLGSPAAPRRAEYLFGPNRGLRDPPCALQGHGRGDARLARAAPAVGVPGARDDRARSTACRPRASRPPGDRRHRRRDPSAREGGSGAAIVYILGVGLIAAGMLSPLKKERPATLPGLATAGRRLAPSSALVATAHSLVAFLRRDALRSPEPASRRDRSNRAAPAPVRSLHWHASSRACSASSGPRPSYAIVYGEISSSLYFALGVVALWAPRNDPVRPARGRDPVRLARRRVRRGRASRSTRRGGSSAITRRAFGDLAGFVVGWAVLLDLSSIIALSLLFVPHYAFAAFGLLSELHSPTDAIMRGRPGRAPRRRSAWSADAQLYLASAIVAIVHPRAGSRSALLGLARSFDTGRDHRAAGPRHRADLGRTSPTRSRSPWSPSPASRSWRTCSARRRRPAWR